MTRDRKTLIYLNIIDLTEEEVCKLSDYGLNICDKCGDIDISEQLYWLEYYYEGKSILKNMRKYTALCGKCHDLLKKKVAKPSKGKRGK